MKKIFATFGIGMLCYATAPAIAQCVPPQFTEEAFKHADQNQDGVIDEAEAIADAAAGFAGLDANGNGVLDTHELVEANPAHHAATDRDGDGRLRFEEVAERQLKTFEEADANKDGVLSLEEVLRYDAARCRGEGQ